MADLRQAMQRLVERPPVSPAAVEVVAARGARFARRRQILRGVVAGAFVVITSAVGLTLARQGSDPEVQLATEGRTSAGYIAEQPGGYVARGVWRLTITRGTQVIELSSASSDYCGRTGFIRPGDEVRGSISGQGSSLRVGERFSCPE